MADYPKISIITPSFNQGQYIEQTILSVLDQQYPNLEYIIVDGGSNDNTVEIIKKYSSQISYWISEPDKGQSDAINKGFLKATGDIVNWINSDDYYAPNTFTNLAASFQEKSVKAVTTKVHNFEEEGAEWDELTPRQNNNVDYIARSFNNQPGTFFRKEIWDRYFPLPKQLRYTMDQYLWFCFWLEHKPAALKTEDYTTVFFRRHAQSKTSTSLTDTIFHHLGKVFFNEHNLIFWSFFIDRDVTKANVLSSYFWDNFDYSSHKVSFPEVLKIDESQAELLFQVYLFEMLKEDFKLGYFERLKNNIRFLNANNFSASEQSIIKKMRISGFSPKAFRTYRRIYWKLKQSVKKL